jgi:hypothetical protein
MYTYSILLYVEFEGGLSISVLREGTTIEKKLELKTGEFLKIKTPGR